MTELDVDNINAPVIPILFYRSMLLAADVAPIDALFDALRQRGIAPVPIFVSSLKDQTSLAFVETALASLNPAAIITATAFASGAEPGVETLFDRAGVPVFPLIVATTRPSLGKTTSAAWRPPTLPCMSCCQNWTAASLPAQFPSRAKVISSRRLAIVLLPIGRNRIA